jgi:hypothetical protein
MLAAVVDLIAMMNPGETKMMAYMIHHTLSLDVAAFSTHAYLFDIESLNLVALILVLQILGLWQVVLRNL